MAIGNIPPFVGFPKVTFRPSRGSIIVNGFQHPMPGVFFGLAVVARMRYGVTRWGVGLRIKSSKKIPKDGT